MTFFFQNRNLDHAAQTRPVRTGITTPGEALASSYDSTVALDQALSVSAGLYDEYEKHRRTLRKVTGQDLFNPFNQPAGDRDRAEASFEERYNKLREQFPELPDINPDSIRAEVGRTRQKIRQRDAIVQEGETGFATGAARFIGATGALMTDPPVLGSMLFGAPWSAGILRTMLIEGGIGAGSEAAVQASLQGARTQVGEQPDLGEAALAIGTAGLGGAAFAGIIKGGAKGMRALIERSRAENPRTSEVMSAEKFLERMIEMEEENPFLDTPAGRQQHSDMLSQTMDRLRGETGIGRVLEDTARPNIRLEVDELSPPVARGEPADQYIARAKEEFPREFGRLEAVEKEIATTKARLDTVRANAAQSADQGLQDQAAKLAELETRRSTVTDPRKAKRLDRQIAGLRGDGDIQKKAKTQRARQQRLQKEAGELDASLSRLDQEKRAAQRRVDLALQKVTAAPLPPVRRFSAKAVLGGDHPSAKALDEFSALGAKMARATDAPSLKGGEAIKGSRDTARPVSRAAKDMIEPEDAELKARQDGANERMETRLKENPDEKYHMVDEDGNTRIVTARELLDDLDDDNKLFAELQDCIAGAI